MTHKLRDINRCSVSKAVWLGKGFYAYKKVWTLDASLSPYIERTSESAVSVIKLFIPTVPCKQLPNPLNNVHRTNVRDKNYAKYRCNGAFIVEGNGVSAYNPSIEYIEGTWIYPSEYNEWSGSVCGGGIHFFLTEDAANAYDEIFNIKKYNTNVKWTSVKSYHDNGQLGTLTEYHEEKGTYTRTVYRENGDIYYIKNIVDWRLDGEYIEYDTRNGTVWKGQYKKDRRVGVWRKYKLEGNSKNIANATLIYVEKLDV